MVKVKEVKIRNDIKKKRKVTKKRSSNVKILNATKVSAYGVEFQSQLEKSMFTKLTEAGFEYLKDFFYEADSVTLIESFDCNNEIWVSKGLSKQFKPEYKKVRKMSYTPDFSSHADLTKATWIIETKGRPNDRFPVVFKLFKLWLNKNNPTCKIYLPSNASQCLATVEKIKNGR